MERGESMNQFELVGGSWLFAIGTMVVMLGVLYVVDKILNRGAKND